MFLLTFFIFFQNDTIKEIKFFNNPNTPNNAFFEMTDIKENDIYDLYLSKQMQQTYLRSGYYDKVTLLAFPRKNGHVLNYYFVEKKNYEFFNYGLFLDLSQNLGLHLGYSWDFIKKTTMRLKTRLLISKNLEDYKINIYDNYIGYNIFYDFSFGALSTDYLFNDLNKSDKLKYHKRFMDTEIGYKLTNRNRISTIFSRYAIKTNDSTLNNRLKEDFYTNINLVYEYENLDWYLFPKKGYHLKYQMGQNWGDNNFNFFINKFEGMAYFNLNDSFSYKSGVYYFKANGSVPLILNDHFEESKNIFGYQDRYLGSSHHSYLFNEIRLISNIEYDPNLENNFMWLIGLESISALKSRNNAITQIFGLNLSWVYKKDLYKLSITYDNKKHINLNLFLRSF